MENIYGIIKLSKMTKQILLIGIALILSNSIYCQNKGTNTPFNDSNEKEWWYPVLQKHQIHPETFYSFKGIFETGGLVIKTDTMIRIEDAVLIIDAKEEYYIMKAPVAIHHLKTNIIEVKNGTEEMYPYNSITGKPVQISKIVFYSYDLNHSIMSISVSDRWRDSTYAFKKYNIKPIKIQ
jgi:hypothetical protein